MRIWIGCLLVAVALFAVGAAGAVETGNSADSTDVEADGANGEYVDLTTLSFDRSTLLNVIVASSPSLSMN